MNSRLFINFAIVAVAALLGVSIARVSSSNLWGFAIGSITIAAIAIGIAGLFSSKTASFENATPPRKLLGMRIGVVGGLISLCGWLIAVFVLASVGYYVAVLGVVVGLVGLAIHFYNVYCHE